MIAYDQRSIIDLCESNEINIDDSFVHENDNDLGDKNGMLRMFNDSNTSNESSFPEPSGFKFMLSVPRNLDYEPCMYTNSRLHDSVRGSFKNILIEEKDLQECHNYIKEFRNCYESFPISNYIQKEVKKINEKKSVESFDANSQDFMLTPKENIIIEIGGDDDNSILSTFSSYFLLYRKKEKTGEKSFENSLPKILKFDDNIDQNIENHIATIDYEYTSEDRISLVPIQQQLMHNKKRSFSESSKIRNSFHHMIDDYLASDDLIIFTHKFSTYPTAIIQSKSKSTPKIPELNTFNTKLYPEYKHQFIKSLINHTRQTRKAMYQRRAMDNSIGAVIILSFYPFPIRTAEVASRIKGIGQDLLQIFKESERSCKGKPYIPPMGKFSTVASAALVSLLDFEVINDGNNNIIKDPPPSSMCSMEELILRINKYTHYTGSGGGTLKHPVEYYLDKKNLDTGWMQICKLCTSVGFSNLEPYLKERRKKALCPSGSAYQLTARGRNLALELKKTLGLGSVTNGPLRQLASHTIDDIYGNVTMNIDYREGGGGNKNLHKMCDILDNYKVPYVVRDLKISDYIFFVGNKLAPYLIERKTVDDVANSLADGRWLAQQRNMRKAQFVLGQGNERKCNICYLIEGDATKRIVHGGNVGNASWNQSLRDVENALDKLPSLGFSVMKTRNYMGSMNVLSRVVQDIAWKAEKGSLECTYEYDEFIIAVNSCEDCKGDPPVDKKYMNPAPPVVDASVVQGGFSAVKFATTCNELIDANTNPTNSTESNREQTAQLMKFPTTQLKQMLRDRDEKIGGKKSVLIERLLKERKPEILITRSRRGQYVPKLTSSNTAILVAMLINSNSSSQTINKEKIMMLAEETGISKDPMCGNVGWYNGWSGMKDLTMGDPALIFVSNQTYSLTTQPEGSSGVDVAKALHIMAHREGLCRCNTCVSD